MSETISVKPAKATWGTSCLICGEFVAYDEMETMRMKAGLHIDPKVCDECKQAILKMKEALKGVEND